MSLSEREQQILREMEESLRAHERTFVNRINRVEPLSYRRARRLGDSCIHRWLRAIAGGVQLLGAVGHPRLPRHAVLVNRVCEDLRRRATDGRPVR